MTALPLPPLARAFVADEDGTTTIEYALIGTLILVACIGGIVGMRNGLGEWWTYIHTSIYTAIGTIPPTEPT